jgi:hypothetical protein
MESNPWIISLGFLCVGPIVMVGFGFWLGRFTRGLRITRVERDGAIDSRRYERAAAPAEQKPKQPGKSGLIRRVESGGR